MSTGRREPRPTRARAGHTADSSARGAHSRSSCGMYGSRIGRVTTATTSTSRPARPTHCRILILHSPSNSVSGARGRGYPARHSKSLASLTQLLCGDMVWQSQTRTILSTFEYTMCTDKRHFSRVGVARARPPPGRAPPGSAGARRSVPPCLDRSAAIGGRGGRIRSPPAARAPDRRELTARRRTQHVPSYCSSSTRRRRRHAT